MQGPAWMVSTLNCFVEITNVVVAVDAHYICSVCKPKCVWIKNCFLLLLFLDILNNAFTCLRVLHSDCFLQVNAKKTYSDNVADCEAVPASVNSDGVLDHNLLNWISRG